MRLCNCYELEDKVLIENNGIYKVFIPPNKKFIPKEDETFYYLDSELEVNVGCNEKYSKFNFNLIKAFDKKDDVLGYKLTLELLLEYTIDASSFNEHLLDNSYPIYSLGYNVTIDELIMIDIKNIDETYRETKQDTILFSQYYFDFRKNLNEILNIVSKDMIKKYIFDVWN